MPPAPSCDLVLFGDHEEVLTPSVMFEGSLSRYAFCEVVTFKVVNSSPDFHCKDLEESITNSAYTKWKLPIQIIPESKERDFKFDILDATKIWPESLVPREEISEPVLNKTVDEYFPEVEQVTFCNSHVSGIGFSDDPLLQGRNFS